MTSAMPDCRCRQSDEVDRADNRCRKPSSSKASEKARFHHAGMAPFGAAAATRGVIQARRRQGRRRCRSARQGLQVMRGMRPAHRQSTTAALLSATGSIASASICRASTLARCPERSREAAGPDQLAGVRGLVIVGRRGDDKDRWTPSRVSPPTVEPLPGRSSMRVGDLVAHILDIGDQLGGNAKLGILARTCSISSGGHRWTTWRRRRNDGSSMPSPEPRAVPVAPWLPPVTRILSGATSSKAGNGSSPSRAISARTGLPIRDRLLAISRLQPVDLVIGRADAAASPASSRLTRPMTAFCS